MDDTTSQQLTSRKDGGSRKIVYMGHQRYETVEIYSMVRPSIEDLHVSGVAPKSMSY